MTAKVIALWAEDEHQVIGRDQTLPWQLPKELKHFKETTMGQALLMGRVTFEGMKRRLLPGRETLILTSDHDYQVEGAHVVHSVEEALVWFRQQEKDLYVIGGAKVFQSFDGYYDGAIKSVIHGQFDGDTYFPQLTKTQFSKVSDKHFVADDKNPYAFTVTYYQRQGK